MKLEQDPFDRSFDSLQALADTISEVIRSPITIEDAHYRLLAYSSHEPKTDPARIATIVGRRVPEHVTSGLWQSGAITKLIESDNPVRVEAISSIGLGNRVAISIKHQNDVIGYIWVMEEEQEISSDFLFHQLKKAAVAAKTKLLQPHMQKRKEEEEYQDLFWQLLTGHVDSDTAAKNKATKLGLKLPPVFQVFIFEFASDIDKKLQQQLQYLLSASAGRLIRTILHVTDRNRYTMLCSPPADHIHASLKNSSEAIDICAAQLKERFGTTFVASSCGSLYKDYTEVEKSYKEAQTVLQVKSYFPSELSDVHHYQKLGFYRLLPLMLEQKQASNYENENLLRIKQYDHEHQSNLLQTLKQYLVSDCNMKAAADALHVHTNTLMYRLKRITEIGDIDLTDMDQKVTLYLDLKMLIIQ
ncbi:PucR family transcriptional regulator [Paenibacillus eucommiae]|uniref:DNA-binding PucR family transcriptional regulator n=1 Tax=Paenibacillus eucommiae TaxID=1355755 RepID=A0ABS4J6Z4_9BACL|nr:helix-turn-helix domain-containing protein [Paenibacillus eucommiae]MBP1995603.1 DNA-binding PucR family transcriptional regulator [Paenibacillus eucommiae]